MIRLLAAVALDVALSFALAVPSGAVFMLLMAVLHDRVSPSVPAIGFGSAYLIALYAGWCYQLLTRGAVTS